LSLQGNTDRKILSARRDLGSEYRRIFQEAAVVFPFSPWIRDYVEARLGKRAGPTITLPCATPQDRLIPPRLVGPKLVSAFHLAHHRLKNAAALIRASKQLQEEIDGFELQILGGGSDKDVRVLEAQIARAGASSVKLSGPVPHDAIQRRMNEAAGLALLSHSESFGMVFVEALLAGCPIAYPKGMAVHGFFENCPFAIAASPGSQAEATEAMRHLVRDEEQLKSALAEWQRGLGPKAFQREAIARTYSEGLTLAAGRAC
jgi:glycosyltransferase involved in cell wall biosynthesis